MITLTNVDTAPWGRCVTVYGASSSHIGQVYFDAARTVGALLAARRITVVDGGGANGLMGAVNDGALDAGGKAVGVIPQFMADRGWGHTGLTEMVVMPDMHTRKHFMASVAAGIIALPGGVGTLDELMEIITWRQLGLFTGPVVILNTAGYYRPLLDMLDRAQEQGFMRKGAEQRLFRVADTPQQAVDIAIAGC